MLVIFPHFLMNGLLKRPKSRKIDENTSISGVTEPVMNLEGIFLFQTVGKFNYHGGKVCVMMNIILGS